MKADCRRVARPQGGGLVLTENDVVKAVAAHLAENGYRIDKALTTIERGIDIVAESRSTGDRLLVEAKGGTSSKSSTARFGEPFTLNQARSHVSVALYCAAKLYHRHSSENVTVALALPDDSVHRGLVNDIASALDVLGIGVFFVGADSRVTERPAVRRQVAAQPGSPPDAPQAARR